MRLVTITSRHAFGNRVLRELSEAGIRLDALVITVQQHSSRGQRERGFKALGRSWRAMARTWWAGWRRWRHLAKHIWVVESPSDRRLRSVLVKARPDVLVLAGTGLIPADVLSIPTLVTLNAHPGLLPWVRGVCPLENALLRGVPLGVTVHAVDAGIDTGPLIRRVLLSVRENDSDRIAVTARLEQAAIDELVRVVKGLLYGEPLSVRHQSSRHPYGSWVSTAEREKAVTLLSKGEAVRLYAKWREIAGGDVLPIDDDPFPGPTPIEVSGDEAR